MLHKLELLARSPLGGGCQEALTNEQYSPSCEGQAEESDQGRDDATRSRLQTEAVTRFS